jgi:hypothetical protein
MVTRTRFTGTLLAVAVLVAGYTFWGTSEQAEDDRERPRRVHFTANWNPQMEAVVRYGPNASRSVRVDKDGFQRNLLMRVGELAELHVTTSRDTDMLACWITVEELNEEVLYAHSDPDQSGVQNAQTCRVRVVVK